MTFPQELLRFNPPVVAHRGASAYAPENTLAAFAKAKALGIHWVELDVMMTADREIIVFHDDELSRTTNGHGLVKNFNYASLKALDAGSWFNTLFAQEHIPTLKEVMNFFVTEQLAVNIELKDMMGEEDQFVARVLAELAMIPEANQVTTIFSSFSLPILRELRRQSPKASLGFLMHEWLPNWKEECLALDCFSIHLNEELLTAETTKQVKSLDKPVLCYTVNQPTRAMQLYAWGVDAVFSDCPDKILAGMVPGEISA